MHFFRNILWIFIIVAIASCSKNESVSPQVKISFLASGTNLTYYYNSLGTDTIKTVIGDQIAKDTFLVTNTTSLMTIVPTQYWTVKDNSLYTSTRLRDPASYVKECAFGQPVGTSWTVTKGLAQYAYSIEQVNVSVTTGKGTVTDAVKVKVTQVGSSASAYQYVSPTVGPIGTGNFEDATAALRLISYKTGTSSTTTNVTPAITYGSFPFLKVGNYWKYDESSFFQSNKTLTVKVESKLSNANIYKVSLTYTGEATAYNYWYEDNGHLMVYEEGESALQADPIYVTGAKAVVGYGWGDYTSSGSLLIYKISALNQSTTNYYGTLSCTAIKVGGGLFSQTNYWNQNKGNVLVDGLFISRDITDTNVRKDNTKTFVPIFGI
jgi:hypothetical protein